MAKYTKKKKRPIKKSGKIKKSINIKSAKNTKGIKNVENIDNVKSAKPIKNDLESSKLWIGFMIGFMLFGLFWLIISYISNGALFKLGNWNLPIGFGFIIVGFIMTTKWK
jgi:uncharacterized membrane protein (DUF485 family)